MICPNCKRGVNEILSEKEGGKGLSVYRVRVCKCGQKFETSERITKTIDQIELRKAPKRSGWKFARFLMYGHVRFYQIFPDLLTLLKFGQKKYPDTSVDLLFKKIFFEKDKNNKHVGIFKYFKDNKEKKYKINIISKEKAVNFVVNSEDYWKGRKEILKDNLDLSQMKEDDIKEIKKRETDDFIHSINTYIKKDPFDNPTIFSGAFEEDDRIQKYFNNDDFQRIFLSIL